MEASIIEQAKSAVRMQADAITALESFIDQDFEAVVKLIHQSKGRVIITGIGKSAIIAQKIAATMNSTGTPAIFMHAADAIHGDLGMVQTDDICIIISKSGESPEIKALVPLIRNFGNPIVALSGHKEGYLAREAHYFLNATVQQEACPNNLAPTTSTTAQMVLGDALAICLLYLKGFSAQDFARFHPGGSLGKRMYLTVSDLMRNNECPAVTSDASLREIIIEISGKRLGATAVLDANQTLLGIITDGDLRRMLETQSQVEQLSASEIMTRDPKTAAPHMLAVEALELLRTHNITQLPVVDNQHYRGMIHLHDIIKEGLI